MKNFNILIMLITTLCTLSRTSNAQSDEDLEILRAKKAFKTKMTDEVVTIKDVSPPQVLQSQPVPTLFADSKSLPPVSTPLYVAFKEPVSLKDEDKTKIRLAFFVNGEKQHTSRGLFRKDQNISLKAYSLNEKVELVITEMQIDIVRNGQKIKSEKHNSTTDVQNLIYNSMPGDQFAIIIKEIYEKTQEGHLKTFTKGNLRVNLNHNY